MTKKIAVLEVNMIKLARKYQTLTEKFTESQNALHSIDASYAKRETDLSKIIQELQ
jgi:hypothetical protein